MKFLTSKNKLSKYGVYAVHKGTLLGHLLVYIDYNKTTDMHSFVSIQNLQNIEVPSKDVEEGIKANLLRDTNIKLPRNMRDICLKQYMFNIENPKSNDHININEDSDAGL